jgi:transcription elongation factor Elf1
VVKIDCSKFYFFLTNFRTLESNSNRQSTMRLIIECLSCNEKHRSSSLLVSDRVDMAKKKGAEFDLRCNKCGMMHKIHVDDVAAEHDFTVLIAGIIFTLVGILATSWLWNKGFIAVASFAILFFGTAAVMNHERNKIKLFNFGKYDSKRNR